MKNLKIFFPITVIVFLMILLLPHFVLPQTNMTLEELLSKADVVAYTRILSSEPHSTKEQGIFTLTKFKILQSIKGTLESDDYSCDRAGGTIGNSGTWVSNSFGIPSSGDAILFLQKHPDIEGRPLVPIRVWGGGSEGKIPIKADQLVDAQRFVDVLKKALTDSTVLPAFYEELRKEEEANIERSKYAYPKAINFQIGDPANIPEEIRKKGQQRIDSILRNEEKRNEKRRMIESMNRNQSNQSVRRTESGVPLPFIQNGGVDSLSGSLKKKH